MISVIKNRRSIRNFKKQPLEESILKEILEAGRLAPSAKNRQPWYFVVLQGRYKDEIADIMIEYANKTDKEDYETKHCKSSVKATANVIRKAPVLVLVYKEADSEWNIGDTLSIGACIENMILQATDLGLGSLWIRDTYCLSKEITDKYCKEKELICSVAFGYSNETPKVRPRKSLNNIVTWWK